jgi:hypothetical protein
MEHDGECSHDRSNEAVSDTICAPCLILDVDMEPLQVCGPLLIVVVLQLPPCLYELQRLVISVDDCFISHNVMFPLTTGLYNGIHFLVIGVNSNLVQYLLQTDIQKRTEKIQWKIQTLHRDFSPGNPNRENQHILY